MNSKTRFPLFKILALAIPLGLTGPAYAQIIGPASPYASAFAVGGNTVNNVTTFGDIVQYQAGVGTYVRLDGSGRNRWGDYSATSLDPSDPSKFWTIQEWASGNNNWSTEIAQFTVDAGNQLHQVNKFQGSSLGNSGFIPPDTMGAVGPNYFAELINGVYAVYDKIGNLQTRTTLNNFWDQALGAGQRIGSAFDPRILYDASSGHWFASALDFGPNANRYANDALLAVSNDSNPLNGWHGVKFTGDLAGGLFADFDTLGINSDGVFVGANVFNTASYQYNTLTAIDKASLIAGTLSGTQFSVSSNDAGFALQPVVDLSGGGLPEIVLATYNDSLLKRSDVTGSFGGTLTLNTGTGYPNKFVSLTDYPAPNPALQPDNANPINTGDNRLSANVIMANGELWATQSVLSEAGRDAIRWLRIDPLTNNVKQEGLISDLNWDFYFASVSVNPSGAVVIGFSGSTDILEPSSLALLALGLAGLWPYSRRHLPH